MAHDLTTGKTGRVLLKFTLPLFISVVFQQFYSIADSMIAGRFAGEDALAAVGASYPITNLFNAVAFGCNIGCGIVISQCFGAKDYKRVKTAVSTALISGLVLGGVLTLLGVVFSPQLLQMINTPENIFADSTSYLAIYTGGFAFLFIYNVTNGIFTSLGDSRTSLYFLIFSSVTNVALDYVAVKYMNMGVRGVAWATFVSQGIACVLSVITMLRHMKRLKTDERASLYSFELLKKFVVYSVPSVLQQSFVSVGNVFIQKLINSFGSSVVAGFSAAMKLNMFTVNCLYTFGNAVSAFTGQNVGAGKYHRIKEGMKYGSIMSIVAGCLFAGIYLGFSDSLIRAFLDSDGSVGAVTSGTAFLMTVTPFYCFIGVKLVGDGILRGVGAMRLFVVVTFADLITRVVLAFVFAPIWGYQGIWYSWPIGWCLATVLSMIFYVSLIKKYKNKKSV